MSSPTPAPSVFRKRGEAEDEKQNRGVDHARVNARADASVSIDPLRPPERLVEDWKIGSVQQEMESTIWCGAAWCAWKGMRGIVY